MSVESTRATMLAYWEEDDIGMVAEDAVYTLMSTGEQARGRAAVERLLHRFYRGSFNAIGVLKNQIIADGQAVWEGEMTGTHIGDFEGIPATGRVISVPLCVVYSLEADRIKTANIYFDVRTVLRQLGGAE